MYNFNAEIVILVWRLSDGGVHLPERRATGIVRRGSVPTREKSCAVGRYRMSRLIIFSTGSTRAGGMAGAMSPNFCVSCREKARHCVYISTRSQFSANLSKLVSVLVGVGFMVRRLSFQHYEILHFMNQHSVFATNTQYLT